jgi:hypothetical protein
MLSNYRYPKSSDLAIQYLFAAIQPHAEPRGGTVGATPSTVLFLVVITEEAQPLTYIVFVLKTKGREMKSPFEQARRRKRKTAI